MDLTTRAASDGSDDLGVPDEWSDPGLAASSTPELLALYGSILIVLRERGVTRSENSPVGDYAEHLASIAFGLTLVNNSAIGYDGADADGVRYQVKGRRITRWNHSRQLSAIRGLGAPIDPFDVLLGMLFDGEFRVWRAALVPLSVGQAPGQAPGARECLAPHAHRAGLGVARRHRRDRARARCG